MQIGGVVQVMFVSARVKQGNDRVVIFFGEGGNSTVCSSSQLVLCLAE